MVKSKNEVEPLRRRGVNGSLSGLMQQRESHGASTSHGEGINATCTQIQRHKKQRNKSRDVGDSESLSDIDDAEITGYLHNKEEMHYKRIIWEAIHRGYAKAKKAKQSTATKKAISSKKAAKTNVKVETQRRSSRINYDALENIDGEWEQGPEKTDSIPRICDSQGSGDTNYQNFSPEMYESRECDDEVHQTTNYYEDDGGEFGYHDYDLFNGYRNEHHNYEDFDLED